MLEQTRRARLGRRGLDLHQRLAHLLRTARVRLIALRLELRLLDHQQPALDVRVHDELHGRPLEPLLLDVDLLRDVVHRQLRRDVTHRARRERAQQRRLALPVAPDERVDPAARECERSVLEQLAPAAWMLKAVGSATLEAARSSSRGGSWPLSGSASSAESVAPPRAARRALRRRSSRARALPRLAL